MIFNHTKYGARKVENNIKPKNKGIRILLICKILVYNPLRPNVIKELKLHLRNKTVTQCFQLMRKKVILKISVA